VKLNCQYFFSLKRHFDPDIVYRIPTQALRAPFVIIQLPWLSPAFTPMKPMGGANMKSGFFLTLIATLKFFFKKKITKNDTSLKVLLVVTTSVWIFYFFFEGPKCVSLCVVEIYPNLIKNQGSSSVDSPPTGVNSTMDWATYGVDSTTDRITRMLVSH